MAQKKEELVITENRLAKSKLEIKNIETELQTVTHETQKQHDQLMQKNKDLVVAQNRLTEAETELQTVTHETQKQHDKLVQKNKDLGVAQNRLAETETELQTVTHETQKQHDKLIQKNKDLVVAKNRLAEEQLEIEKAKTQFETIAKQQHNELVRGAIELSEIRDEQEIVKDNLKDINETYDKLKLLLNRKQSAKTKRQNNQSSKEMLSSHNTTR